MQDPEVCAAHEIGHYVMAKEYNIKTAYIDITNLQNPHIKFEYGNMLNAARKIHELKLNMESCDDETLRFSLSYISVIISGFVCEELYKTNFSTSSCLSLPWQSTDYDIVKHYFDRSQVESGVNFSAELCMSKKGKINTLLGLLLENKGYLSGAQLDLQWGIT